MANSTATIFIKPTIAFNRGDTFVFGSWVCTADGAGSFQRRLTMPPNSKTGLVTLPEVVTGDLARKFGKILLYNQHTDFELGSDSNSNLTSPWAIACKPAIEPSCADSPLHEHFPYGLCIASKAHAKALSARRAGKEIASEYDSDSNPISGYYSNSSYEFDFGADPDEPESETYTMEQPLSGPTSSLVITSTPAGRFVYWPDRKPADLTDENSRCVAYLDSLPFQEGTPLAPTEEHTPTEVATSDSSLGSPDRQVFMTTNETPGPSGTVPDRYLEDISADELSANAPANETDANRDARPERNRKRNERRRRLRESLPIRNLAKALDQVKSGVHTTPEQCLMSITTKSSPSSRRTPTSCELTTGSLKCPPSGTSSKTTKPQVTVQTSVTTVLEGSYLPTPTVPRHRPVDPLMVATAPAAPAATVRSSLTVILAAEAVTAGAPTMGLAGEPGRRRPRRLRPREQPHLWRFMWRLRRPPEDRRTSVQEVLHSRRQRWLPRLLCTALQSTSSGEIQTFGDHQYDTKQDPVQWLRCYTLSIENAGGNNDTKCLYFPFCLDQAPLTWLESLEKYSINKWD
jgi:hypothetical protein